MTCGRICGLLLLWLWLFYGGIAFAQTSPPPELPKPFPDAAKRNPNRSSVPPPSSRNASGRVGTVTCLISPG
jgi:hypothetical protein